MSDHALHLAREAQREVRRLRAERDEALRLLREAMALVAYLRTQVIYQPMPWQATDLVQRVDALLEKAK